MKHIELALLFCALFLPQLYADIQKINIPLDKAKLEKGELQTHVSNMKTSAGAAKRRVVGVVIINAPPAKVWKALENWEAMPAFIPGLVYYKIMHRVSPDVLLIEGVIKEGLIKILYTLRVRFDKQRMTQEWNFIGDKEIEAYSKKGVLLNKPTSNIKNVEGFEYIEPYGDGSRTIYYYAPIIEAKAVPEWIERILAKRGLEGYMLGVKKKVEGK